MANENARGPLLTAQRCSLWFAFSILCMSLWVQAADLKAGLDAYDRGDYETAERELLSLAEEGNAEAQFRLAVMHEYVRGSLGNPLEAFHWYRKAAESGHPKAQVQLAIHYRDGIIVGRNLVEAYAWFDNAAGQGIENAERAKVELAKSLAPDVLARARDLANSYRQRVP